MFIFGIIHRAILKANRMKEIDETLEKTKTERYLKSVIKK